MTKKAYGFRRRLPVLRPSYVLTMDVLGFSDHVQQSRNEIAGLHSYWKEVVSILKDLKPAKHAVAAYAFKAYVDNALLAFPIHDDGESEFGSAWFYAAWCQMNLATRGWFVRGAITVGNAFVSDDLVFGNPVIEGHNLESTIAEHPRIIISDDVAGLARRYLRYYARGQGPQVNGLCVQGNRRFINYLNLAFDGSLEDYEVNDALTAHKGHIESNLARFAKKPRVARKYRWLAGYHNAVIKRALGNTRKYLIPGIRALPLGQFS